MKNYFGDFSKEVSLGNTGLSSILNGLFRTLHLLCSKLYSTGYEPLFTIVCEFANSDPQVRSCGMV